MAKTIPVSQVVTVNPGVIGTGGNPLALNGVFVTTNAEVPIGQLLQFYSAEAVAEYFCADSQMAEIANKYFLSFDNSQQKPQSILFARYAQQAVPAWLRGTPIKAMTITQLNAVSGDLSITINGKEYKSSEIALASATSFTNAAELLTTQLNLGDNASVTWDVLSSTFRIQTSETGANTSIELAEGNVADALGLSAGTASQGADADTANTAMERMKSLSLNWATFTIVEQGYNLDDFCVWVNNQNRRYLFIPWDNDPKALVANSACLGQSCSLMKWEAVLPVWDNVNLAAMVMGSFASVDWNAFNGRIDIAFKSQSGLSPTCDNLQDAETLLLNGYSYYGTYAANGENNTYNFFYNGQLPGSQYGFSDSYINQIFLNSQLQLSIINGMMGVRSIPYNDEGKALIRLWCADPINQALNNGTIRTGVTVSQAQKAQIISSLRFDITTELETQGYYLYIGEATAQTRGTRQSPPISFFYMDGGSIQQITINSIVVL
ncbi:MAG: DUF3383 domain-containing protein [Oxalobacter formigenes]|nr:DUF3383 domain-containing protein [Oxalobacter formigenes]